MSQEGVLSFGGSGAPVIETLTGNSGGAVGPDGSFNIDILGNNSSGINVIGNPAINTLTIVGIQATTSQQGTITLATNAQAIAGTDTFNAITSDDLKAKLGTQTAHSLAVFEGTSSALHALGVAGNGVLPIGSAGSDPVLANITSSSGTITITNGPGSINIDVSTGTHIVETLTGNTGGAISPTAGNINTVGTGSITIAGSGSTLTTQLTGLTNHAIQIGAGTATLTQLGPGTTGQILQTNTTANPTWSTATYPSTATGTGTILRADGTNWVATTATYPATTTINQILYSSSANTVAGLATANNGVLTTGTTGIPVITALGTDGQIIIGSSTGAPAAATLTPGNGIAIANGHNSITISVSGEGFVWSDKAISFNAAASNGYFVTGNATATLPASPSNGDAIAFFVDGAVTLTIQANTGQTIQLSSNISSAAGTQVNTANGDACELVYRSTDTKWCATSFVGAWNKT